MRSLEEINEGFKEAIKKATDSFIGDKLSKDTADKVQAAVNNAAYNYYRNGITNQEIDYYDIRIPNPKVRIHGPNISIED